MTNPKLTSVTFIVDSSGSMASTQDDVIGGFNKFIEDQKKADGECIVTLATFSDKCHVAYTATPIKDVPVLSDKNYRPSGNTALLDAIGITVNTLGSRLGEMDEADRPGNVVCVIITDGRENASCQFTKDKIKEMIKHQETTYSWNFIFMGANIDAVADGSSLGMGVSLNYVASHTGTQRAYDALSRGVTRYRTSGNIVDVAGNAINVDDVK